MESDYLLLSNGGALKELRLEFDGNGEVKYHRFKQLIFQNNAYITEVCDTFGNKRHEVFKRVKNSRFRQMEFPKWKAFGVTAWNAKSLELPIPRFHQISC